MRVHVFARPVTAINEMVLCRVGDYVCRQSVLLGEALARAAHGSVGVRSI
jgi:hypothetical protein